MAMGYWVFALVPTPDVSHQLSSNQPPFFFQDYVSLKPMAFWQVLFQAEAHRHLLLRSS